MIIDLTALADEIERGPAEATVNAYGVDAIWISPTVQGAVLRASLCLLAGYDPAEVGDALHRFEDSVPA